MSIPSSQKISNATTAAVVAYALAPEGQIRNTAIAAAVTGALAISEAEQGNLRLATSALGGAALAWRLSSENTSAKTLTAFTLVAGTAIYLGQYVLAQSLTRHPEQVQLIPTVARTFFNTSAVQAVLSSAGPQAVNVTASQQPPRETVGNRAG